MQTYYGSKDERAMLRHTLHDTQRKKNKEDGWDVLITTYNLASGDDRDRKFFRKTQWDVRCVSLVDDTGAECLLVLCVR